MSRNAALAMHAQNSKSGELQWPFVSSKEWCQESKSEGTSRLALSSCHSFSCKRIGRGSRRSSPIPLYRVRRRMDTYCGAGATFDVGREDIGTIEVSDVEDDDDHQPLSALTRTSGEAPTPTQPFKKLKKKRTDKVNHRNGIRGYLVDRYSPRRVQDEDL
eukprot:1451372-Amphidinium_carterae.1